MALGTAQDDRIAGDLAVGCFSTLGPMYLPAIMRTFVELYPEVKLRIVEGDTEELVSKVERGMLDLAIIYDMGLLRELTISPLGQQSPYVLLPAGHRLANRPALQVKELSGEPFILIDLPHSRDYFLSILQVGGVAPQVVLKTRSIEMVRSLVANGHGVSILVTRPSRDYSYDGKRIVCKPLEGKIPPQKIVAATSGESRLSAAAEAFVRVARNHI